MNNVHDSCSLTQLPLAPSVFVLLSFYSYEMFNYWKRIVKLVRLVWWAFDVLTLHELHVLMQCPLYADLRQKMSNDVLHFKANFSFLSDADKFVFLFSNENVFNIVAKTCYNILIRRNSFFYAINYCVNIILYNF